MKFEDYYISKRAGEGSLVYTERVRNYFTYDYNGNKSQGCGNMLFSIERKHFSNNLIYEYK